jgi:hypothetical protein
VSELGKLSVYNADKLPCVPFRMLGFKTAAATVLVMTTCFVAKLTTESAEDRVAVGRYKPWFLDGENTFPIPQTKLTTIKPCCVQT